MKLLFASITMLISAVPAGMGAAIFETFTKSSPSAMPDGVIAGIEQSIEVTTAIDFLDEVTVTVETTGGWNGDLYAYLWHDNVVSVLVNRIGRTTSATAGSSGSGLSLTLADSAAADVHLAGGTFGALTSGTYQPDGRQVSPLLAVNTSPRTAPLAAFNGMDPNGTWRLHIADVAAGDVATLQSWSVTFGGALAPLPEPGCAAFCAFAGAGLLLRRSRGCFPSR